VTGTTPVVPAPRCAVAAGLRGDPMAGSAAPAAGFLLVEQPGGWGRQALTSSRLDPRVGAALSARAIAVGLRVLLIRRPGRHQAPVRRSWAVVSARPGREATWWGRFGADDELRSLPLDGSAGTRSTAPFYLVCTHGRHDQCCAIEGRPVAEALNRLRPGSAWECSHVGGDRFAANVVAMPHGVYYGRVEQARAADLVTAHERAEVVPDLVRGRSTAVIEALAPAGVLHLGAGRWQVRLRASPHHLIVTVQAGAAGEPGLLTCHARHEAHPPVFEVLEVREVR
jgi:Sucrase/ferredoxin-like